MTQETYTKRADLKIRDLAHALSPEIPKSTISWEEAWDILTEHSDLGGSLETTLDGKTVFELYRGDDVIHSFSWKNEEVFIEKDGSWDWVRILREVLTYVLSNKLVKRPRAKRKDAGVKKSQKKSLKKLPSKSNKKAKNSGDLALTLDSIRELFIRPKNNIKCDLTHVEKDRWKAKRFSANETMYRRYKEHKDISEHMNRYINIIQTMRSHGMKTTLRADWIKHYFGLC